MDKYTLGALLLAAILLMGSYVYSAGKSTTAPKDESATATITVTGDRHNFGTIDIFGGKVETTYTLKNEGPDDVMITAAQTSCMCTEGEIAGYTFGMHGGDVPNVVIPAGGEEVVTAVFDPLAHGPNGTGKITRELTLQTNSLASPEIHLRFSGEVVKSKK